MAEGFVKQVDRANGRLTVHLDDGREISLSVDEHTDISVMELETAGDIDGTLDDIEEGYLVAVDFTEGEDGCKCHTLSCIS